MFHKPVLLNECLEAFNECRLDIFFDGTLGGGGHAKAMLTQHPELIRYLGCDRDESALRLAAGTLELWSDKLQLIHGNYADIDLHLESLGIEKIDGCLLDLGVSSMQLDQDERGFSFSKDGPLDMRMDRSQSLTAQEIVNTWPERKLAEIFRDYGELKPGPRLAKALCLARKKVKFETTKQLSDWVKTQLGRGGKKIHPATLVFQALRIAVNGELEGVWQGVVKALHVLKEGGRLAVITFHSLEDRIVKNIMRQAARPDYDWEDATIPDLPLCKLLTKKPINPSFEEVKSNPRARSAHLRVVERLG